MSDKPCKATPPDELLEQLLDCRVPKTEREHFAASKIEQLQAENQRIRDGLGELIDKPDYTNLSGRIVPEGIVYAIKQLLEGGVK